MKTRKKIDKELESFLEKAKTVETSNGMILVTIKEVLLDIRDLLTKEEEINIED